MEFFAYYISPSSPNRSKLGIHLRSGTPKPEEGAAGVSALDQAKGQICLPTKNRKAYKIENIRDFKSLLTVSGGPQPVKDLSKFGMAGLGRTA
jgi:insulysin